MAKKLAVLISDAGTGSNLQAIIDAIEKKYLNARIEIVLSNTKSAAGFQRARECKLKTCVADKNTDYLELFRKDYPVDFIVLAGWRLIIPDALIDEYKNRILNLHPGLVPSSLTSTVKNPDGTVALWNRGKLTDGAIAEFFKKRKTYGGSSIHFLSHEFDYGKVLGRVFEKARPDDTIETFYKRLKKKENKLYVEVLRKLCN